MLNAVLTARSILLASFRLVAGVSGIHAVSLPPKRDVVMATFHPYCHVVTSSRRLRHDFLEVLPRYPFLRPDFATLARCFGFGAVAHSTPGVLDLTKELTDSSVNRTTLPVTFALSSLPSLAHFKTVRLSTLKMEATSSGVRSLFPARFSATGVSIDPEVTLAGCLLKGKPLHSTASKRAVANGDSNRTSPLCRCKAPALSPRRAHRRCICRRSLD